MKLDSGLVKTTYVPSRSQLADVLTKGQPTKQFQDLTNMLRMIDTHSSTWREVL